jgi:hypothetical protein
MWETPIETRHKMLATHAHAPALPAAKSSYPTPGQTQATWATIILFLLAFWYGVGVGVNALWGVFAG